MPYKNIEDRRAQSQRWRHANREKSRKALLKSYYKYRERILIDNRKKYANNPKTRKRIIAKQVEYHRNRRKTDSEFRLLDNLRRRVNEKVKAVGARKSSSTRKLFGCEIYQLQAHLEIQFRDGMTWENYGSVWHVDHKRPCRSFDLTEPAQQQACFHYTNLQPLFATENKKKGGKWLTK
jgi:hypothetical protein